MIHSFLLKNVRWHNADPGSSGEGDVLVRKGRIESLGGEVSAAGLPEYDGRGHWLLPGMIDDQVHFRDFDLSHKATIESESRAAVAGGVTSYMEMPNTRPAAINKTVLDKKFDRAAQVSAANYGFYVGATEDNHEDVMSVADDPRVPGLKIFMGSSTGNMLVEDPGALERFFRDWPRLIATHCEDEATIHRNLETATEHYGSHIPMNQHPVIRSVEACLLSSSRAVALAEKFGTRLHVLHLTTETELDLFRGRQGDDSNISCEVCVHHLHFTADDYARLGSRIKCNPAIKSGEHRQALWKAFNEGVINVIATDHAPHTIEEKNAEAYVDQPAGLPLVQHGMLLMLDAVAKGLTNLPRAIQGMCHAPADLYRLKDRGYLREGYFADMVLVDPEGTTPVESSNLEYLCGWSPLEGETLQGKICATWVNGQLAFDAGQVQPGVRGRVLEFAV
jgi:dihydroorotase